MRGCDCLSRPGQWALALLLSISVGNALRGEESFPVVMLNDSEAFSDVEIVQTGLLNPDPDALLGLLVSTAEIHSDFISPMTNPVFFEDPRTLTEARLIYLHHAIPEALGGQSVDVAAMQLRAALTERLSFIATKDGFIFSDSPLLSDGWADVAAGLKYQLISDQDIGRMLTSGFTFEMPIGSSQALQGNGNGEFNFFVTGGQRLFEYMHLISATGWRQPTDRSEESSVFYWSNHVDYMVTSDLYALFECNWYHWMSSGDGGVPGIEGGDLINLGSTGVGGNNIVTGAFGFKYKPDPNVELGLAYEFPLSERQDLMENRITIDAILRY